MKQFKMNKDLKEALGFLIKLTILFGAALVITYFKN